MHHEEAINSSDNLLDFASLLHDNLSHLFINKQTQDELRKRLTVFNKYYNEKIPERFNIINDFNKYLELYFKKENIEMQYGIGIIDEPELNKIDSLDAILKKQFNIITTQIYNSTHQKNHLQSRWFF